MRPVSSAAAEFDWRYYFVKYPAMRQGAPGMYATENDILGYSVCMLDKTQMNSHYREAYSFAVAQASGARAARIRTSPRGSDPG